MSLKVYCPNCHSAVTLPQNGGVVETLTCQICGERFLPRFYCPDANFSLRHVVVPTALYVDNEGAVYAFCPEHTYTTHALIEAEKPRPALQFLETLARYLDSLLFRLVIEIEGLRWRLSSRL